jgi:hypothetical protein
MTEHKLDDRGAMHCGGQLVDALERIEARHNWSNGDTVAVAIVAITEIVARRIGPTKTIELFRDHAAALEEEHLRKVKH